MVGVKSWLDGGRLIENPMFRSSVRKFEGVRIHLPNGQPLGTLRRSSQRSGSKSSGKGCVAAMDSSSALGQAMQIAHLIPPPPSTNNSFAGRRIYRQMWVQAYRRVQTTAQSNLPLKAQLLTIPIQTYCKIHKHWTNACYSLMGYCIGASSMHEKDVMFLRVGKFMFS